MQPRTNNKNDWKSYCLGTGDHRNKIRCLEGQLSPVEGECQLTDGDCLLTADDGLPNISSPDPLGDVPSTTLGDLTSASTPATTPVANGTSDDNQGSIIFLWIIFLFFLINIESK